MIQDEQIDELLQVLHAYSVEEHAERNLILYFIRYESINIMMSLGNKKNLNMRCTWMNFYITNILTLKMSKLKNK